MIFGVGTDVVELSRIQAAVDRFGDRFARRILMEEEFELYRASKWPVRFLAMRFAGKEAAVKALGTGFRHGVWIRDVGITSNDWGRPLIIWSERDVGGSSELCRTATRGVGRHVQPQTRTSRILAAGNTGCRDDHYSEEQEQVSCFRFHFILIRVELVDR